MDESLPLSLPRAVLFDMDGTLTRPLLDFPRIKAEMGIGAEPILEALERMDAASRCAAEQVLLRHEAQAAADSSLNPGCDELLEWLAARGVATALITRNSRQSTATVIALHGLAIETLVTREDAAPKPDPEPLRLACRKLGVAGADAWMVGDGEYDVEAGRAAGVRTVWVSHGEPRWFSAEPWRVVRDLIELRALLASIVSAG